MSNRDYLQTGLICHTVMKLLGITLPKSTLPMGGRVWTEKQMATGVLGVKKPIDNLAGSE